MTLECWFPTVIFHEDLDPPDEVHTDMLEYVDGFFEKYKDQFKYTDTENITGDVHNDYLLHHNPIFYWLNRQISDAAVTYLTALGTDAKNLSIYAQKSWPTVCKRNNGMVDNHIHKNSVLSVVYYLKCENNGSGRICFENPNTLLHDIALTFPNTNELNCERCCYAPIEKRMIMFPSNLDHSVESFNGIDNRYSISYDLTVVAKKDCDKNNEFLITDPSLWRKLT